MERELKMKSFMSIVVEVIGCLVPLLYHTWAGLQGESERNRKFATLALPTAYDGLNVIVSERVGHIRPVDAVVRAGIPIGCPGQPTPAIVNGE
jgi:hypothetical protein